MVRYKRSNRANPGALQWGHPKRSGTGVFRTGFADNSYPDVKRVGFAITPRLVCAVNARNSRGEIAGRVWQPACAGRYVLTRKLWRVQFPPRPLGLFVLSGATNGGGWLERGNGAALPSVCSRPEWRRVVLLLPLHSAPSLHSSGTITVEPPPISRTR